MSPRLVHGLSGALLFAALAAAGCASAPEKPSAPAAAQEPAKPVGTAEAAKAPPSPEVPPLGTEGDTRGRQANIFVGGERLPQKPAAPAAVTAEEKPAGPEKPVPPKPAEPPKQAEPPKPAETDDQFLERITGEMMRKVEEVRGLKFKQDVKRVWKSREEARVETLAEIDKDMSPEKQASMSRELAFFGLLPEGANLKEVFSDFISAGAGGYYNPETKVFSLVRGFKEDASRPIVFHELVHAVEDQYFDFNAREKRLTEADQGDGASAIQALVEGSARTFEDRFVDSEPGLRMKYFKASQEGENTPENAAKVQALPPVILIAEVMYPYGNGSTFLREVVPVLEERKVQDPFGSVYADPPASTEQVLHPAKYLEPDLPREVRLPEVAPILGEGWTVEGVGTEGELGIGLVLNAALLPYNMATQLQSVMRMPGKDRPLKTPEDMARFMMTPVVQFRGEVGRAAEGWDGDRFALLGNGGRMALAWVTVWDTEGDAAEFAAAYGKAVARKYGTVTEEKREDGTTKKNRVPPASAELKEGDYAGTLWTGTRDGVTAVLAKGDRVLVLERVPAGKVADLAGALAEAVVVQDRRDAVPARPAKARHRRGSPSLCIIL